MGNSNSISNEILYKNNSNYTICLVIYTKYDVLYTEIVFNLLVRRNTKC